jgi:hypothetical protein
VNTLELGVKRRKLLDHMRSGESNVVARRLRTAEPVVDTRTDIRPRRRLQPRPQRLDVSEPELAGRVPTVQTLRRKEMPCGLDDSPVDLAQLRESHAGANRLAMDRLAVDPKSCVGIPLDLQIRGKLLAADGPSLEEQKLHLALDERVALDRSRVMRLLVPDVLPDALRFVESRQAAHAIEIHDRSVEPLVDHLTTRPRHLTR